MKIEKLDHKHALTSWLKVILFACLMLAPIMSVVVRSLYVVCNKNAKDSYSGQETIQYESINNVSDLQIGKTYHFNARLGTYTNSSQSNTNRIYYTNIQNLYTTNDYIEEKLSQSNNFNLYYSTSALALYFFDNETNTGSTSITTYECSFDFILMGYNESAISNNLTFLTYKNMSNYNYVDNVFDYSISQIEQSQFYNWTQNTAIYNGVEAMTTGLGITGATVPILITYWFLLTVIYIVIDIVINLFTYLTHFLNKKTN